MGEEELVMTVVGDRGDAVVGNRRFSVECSRLGYRYRLSQADASWRATRVSQVLSSSPRWDHQRFGSPTEAMSCLWAWWIEDLVMSLEARADRFIGLHRDWLQGRPGFVPRSPVLRQRVTLAANDLAAASIEAAAAMRALRRFEADFGLLDVEHLVPTSWISCGDSMLRSGKSRVRLESDGTIIWA